MLTRLIGDIHGELERYQELLRDWEGPSIQVGDFGLGFDSAADAEAWRFAVIHKQHRFIRGNHDDLRECMNNPGWIPDGTLENGVLYIGGAWSIDRDYRILGVSWWPDEELSFKELDDMIERFTETKPRVVISHDAPEMVARQLFAGHRFTTRTALALQEMFDSWKPELWVFGHYHQHRDAVIDGTRFICLDILEFADVDLESCDVIAFRGHPDRAPFSPID